MYGRLMFLVRIFLSIVSDCFDGMCPRLAASCLWTMPLGCSVSFCRFGSRVIASAGGRSVVRRMADSRTYGWVDFRAAVMAVGLISPSPSSVQSAWIWPSGLLWLAASALSSGVVDVSPESMMSCCAVSLCQPFGCARWGMSCGAFLPSMVGIFPRGLSWCLILYILPCRGWLSRFLCLMCWRRYLVR